MVARLYKDNDELNISKDGAAALYLGIVGDTSRFLYRNTDERTFDACIALLKTGIDIVEIYNRIYLRSASELEVNKFILNIGLCFLFLFVYFYFFLFLFLFFFFFMFCMYYGVLVLAV